MKILLTGATGYIGKRLLPALIELGHEVVCVVRDKARIDIRAFKDAKIEIIEANLIKSDTMQLLPKDIDIAYYLVHSMSTQGDFSKTELKSADNFTNYLDKTEAKQLIYLSGIINEKELSNHLKSRKAVEERLRKGKVSTTVLRAGIIIGSGSASFEIIRDLVEKLPIMVAPKWLKTKCQPIAVRNVIEFLTGVICKTDTYNKHFDIYGPNLLSYKQMLEQFAEVRKLKRKIIIVPVFTPKLSSYWLYFVTSTSYDLAKNLVDSMKIDVIPKENDLFQKLNIHLIPYTKAIDMAFEKIEQNLVLSSWNDSSGSSIFQNGLSKHIEIPKFGVLLDKQKMKTDNPEEALERIFSIGGKNGWYYGDWLWGFRGFLDKLFGGVGLKRGRKNAQQTSPGDALDFWRVILSSKEQKRLLLYAEMKLPGEAWLEFCIDEKGIVHQTATFRPLGIAGRLYWIAMLPFHYFIFRGMLKRIVH
ncbi:SDR family oxidoreductase [Pedobacter aquatilis]|uniref:SDR family oxidoreductase n=1 Tax=Pedobacter aquatilis TaxID=351343 RepID=UPI0025B45AA8|nr:SDR family oxidoreductase [Pedobacter aquatilis]MDN3588279.1 SDR family oxidoreductase [Pedobacter aquatilis]